ncbi:3-keto-disaccharide hydrolase [Bryobacter aggregatus]|uniref:3-keto-disaccharide hydrolase n=1 Tax=Bryobacter aggregatus TaxID=360054 RepID=UPI0004E0F877|nr:DUF1080 domain-containing protein [Bryobacter aggregatus]
MRILIVVAFCLSLCAKDGFVSLMPKHDLSEHWTVEGATPPEAWMLRDGVIATTGQPNGFLRSKKKYRNFILRADWRFQKGWKQKEGSDEEWPNAGFFIHAGPIQDGWPTSLEVQGYFGEVGSLFGVRGGKITGAKRGPFVKEGRPAFGEWDHYEITSQNGHIRVVLNGVLVNEGTGAWPEAGNVCLQSEGWPVYYRNVEIKELP